MPFTHGLYVLTFLFLVARSHLLNTYGDSWRVPDISYHGVTQKVANFWGVQQALLARLAVTAWGDVTWPERRSRCAALQKKHVGGTGKPPLEDTAQQEQEQDQDQELEQEQREQMQTQQQQS